MSLPAPRRPPAESADRDRDRWLAACADVYDRAREAARAHMTCAATMIRTNQGGALILRITGPSRTVPEAVFLAEGFGGFGDLGYQVNG